MIFYFITFLIVKNEMCLSILKGIFDDRNVVLEKN